MSKRQPASESLIAGPKEGEKFMALILWAQQSTCTCPSCEYMRDMARQLISAHMPEAKPRG